MLEPRRPRAPFSNLGEFTVPAMSRHWMSHADWWLKADCGHSDGASDRHWELKRSRLESRLGIVVDGIKQRSAARPDSLLQRVRRLRSEPPIGTADAQDDSLPIGV